MLLMSLGGVACAVGAAKVESRTGVSACAVARSAAVPAVAPAAQVVAQPASRAPRSSPALAGATSPAPRPAPRWIAAPARDEAAELERWCAGVGPPVIERRVVQPAYADSLAIITWNTRVGGGDVGKLVNDLRAGRLTGGRPVRHFVLLLQEVYRAGEDVPPAGPGPDRIAAAPPEGERRDIRETAAALGLDLFYVPSMRNGGAPHDPPEDRGNAILSTLALSEHTAIELPFEAQRRVALTAALAGWTSSGAPWRLHLTNMHLDHRSRAGRLLASLGAGRLRQVGGALPAIPANGPAVLGGDLNTWAATMLEDAIPYLLRVFPDTPPSDPRPTFSLVPGLARKLDHLFFRLDPGQTASVRRLESRYGSDHYPVLGWVRFAAASGAVSAAGDGPDQSSGAIWRTTHSRTLSPRER